MGSTITAQEELLVPALDGVLEGLSILGLLSKRFAEVVGLGSDLIDCKIQMVSSDCTGDVGREGSNSLDRSRGGSMLKNDTKLGESGREFTEMFEEMNLSIED